MSLCQFSTSFSWYHILWTQFLAVSGCQHRPWRPPLSHLYPLSYTLLEMKIQTRVRWHGLRLPWPIGRSSFHGLNRIVVGSSRFFHHPHNVTNSTSWLTCVRKQFIGGYHSLQRLKIQRIKLEALVWCGLDKFHFHPYFLISSFVVGFSRGEISWTAVQTSDLKLTPMYCDRAGWLEKNSGCAVYWAFLSFPFSTYVYFNLVFSISQYR